MARSASEASKSNRLFDFYFLKTNYGFTDYPQMYQLRYVLARMPE
ncbi:Ferredoxin [Mannheimia varigena USDA-ARS-USMARC-1388]|nr:Ferredoxin [Mannheimia varigena USDA-ARS-USMARC-1388]